MVELVLVSALALALVMGFASWLVFLIVSRKRW
jgi:hypothetical protein